MDHRRYLESEHESGQASSTPHQPLKQGYFVCFAQRGAGPGEIGRGLSGESRGVPEFGATGSCQPKQAGPRP